MQQWALVTAITPFSDGSGQKERPVLVVSGADHNKACMDFIAMPVSSNNGKGPRATDIEFDFRAAGANRECYIKPQLWTLSKTNAKRIVGTLSPVDKEAVQEFLRKTLAL